MPDVDNISEYVKAKEGRLNNLRLQQARQGYGTPADVTMEIGEIENELRELRSRHVTPSLGLTKTVQLVVVAMNREQADQLNTELVFEDSDRERKQFRRLKEALEQYGVGNWLSSYEEKRDDWRPVVTDQELSIMRILLDVRDRLNSDARRNVSQAAIELESLSEEFLSSDIEQRRLAWSKLKYNGGILVIDAVSLYHPDLRTHLINSQVMEPKDSLAMIVISPLKSRAISINDILTTQIYGTHLQRAYYECVEEYSPFYEFGTSDISNLRRWLFHTIPSIKSRGLGEEKRAALRLETGLHPLGIGAIAVGVPQL